MTVAAVTDLRPMFGPPRDQGRRPTCLAFAASDTHAALRGAWAALSCEFAYYHAQKRANRSPADGATLPAMLDAIRADGQPVETAWPYLAALPNALSDWQPPHACGALFKRAGGSFQASIDAIIVELMKGNPLILLMQLSASFFRGGLNGVVDLAAGEQPDPSLRHAVIAVGHGDASGQRAVLVRNSWGSRWGDNGYAWITEAFLAPRLFGLAFLKEDLSVSAISASPATI